MRLVVAVALGALVLVAGPPRAGAGPAAGGSSWVLGGSTIEVQVAGVGGVPADGVEAVALSVTAVGATAETYLTVWPAGASRPLASQLNPAPGRTVANTVLTAVGPSGTVSVYNDAGAVQVVVDVLGWFPAGGGYHGLTPSRVLDTRLDVPLGPRGTRSVPVAGVGGVPLSAAAVALNVTTTASSAASFVTLWPAGTPMPPTSNLNPRPGRTMANLAVVPVGADGRIEVSNDAGTGQVVLDVVGWFASGVDATGARRLLDTRSGPPVVAGTPVGIEVPPAAVVNVTAVDASTETFLTVYPDGSPRPWASNLNPAPGPPAATAVPVAAGAGGRVLVANDRGTVHVVVDLLATLGGGYRGLPPARVLDTRPPGPTAHAYPVPLEVVSGFGRTHAQYPATDVFAACGTPVRAMADGTVVEVRRVDAYDPAAPATFGGRSVAVLGDDGVRYYTSHLDVVAVGVGARVVAGTEIGTIGLTGDSRVCHVHVGLSPPCPGPEWAVRRGVVWPWPYLAAWRDGRNPSPAPEVASWQASDPDACARAQAMPDAADGLDR